MSQTNEKAFESYVETILTEKSGWQAAIERLREYRTALITAAVTGKIDVRGHAPGPSPARVGEGRQRAAGIAQVIPN